MKRLVRGKGGKQKVIEVKEEKVEMCISPFPGEMTSPIITKINKPKSLIEKIVPQALVEVTPLSRGLPKKSDMPEVKAMTKEKLLEEMIKAGGKNLSTHKFAEMITPCVKKSDDPIGHHRWDISCGHVRQLVRQLEEEGSIRIIKDTSSKRTRYLYEVV